MNILPPLTDDVVIKYIIGQDLDLWLDLQCIPSFARQCLQNKGWWNRYFGYTGATPSDTSTCETCKCNPTLEHAFECALTSNTYHNAWGWNNISCKRPFYAVSNIKLDLYMDLTMKLDGISFLIDDVEFRTSLNGEIFFYEQKMKGCRLVYHYNFGIVEAFFEVSAEEVTIGKDTWRVWFQICFRSDNAFYLDVYKNGRLVRSGTLFCDLELCISQIIKDKEEVSLLLENIPPFTTRKKAIEALNRDLFSKALYFYHKTYQTQTKTVLPDRYDVYCCSMCKCYVAMGRNDENNSPLKISMEECCTCGWRKVECYHIITLQKGKLPEDFFKPNSIHKFISKQGKGVPMWIQKLCVEKDMLLTSGLEKSFGIDYETEN